MNKLYMFVTDPAGHSTEVRVDPANIADQQRDYEAAGFTVTILDEDERISYGLLANNIAGKHRRGAL